MNYFSEDTGKLLNILDLQGKVYFDLCFSSSPSTHPSLSYWCSKAKPIGAGSSSGFIKAQKEYWMILQSLLLSCKASASSHLVLYFLAILHMLM